MSNYLQHRFKLNTESQAHLQSLEPNFGFGVFSQIVYYDHYSRLMENGQKEEWADTIIRCVNGTFSILKNHMLVHHLPWDEAKYQKKAHKFAQYMFDMLFLPPGRGLYICGTEFMYTRGSAALNNCGFTSTENLHEAACWTFEMLMYGVGIGFNCQFDGDVYFPKNNGEIHYVQDSREGWVESLSLLLKAFLEPNQNLPIFNYSLIRPAGAPLKSFGGTSSGYEPLEKLHKRIVAYFSCYYYIQKNTTKHRAKKFKKINQNNIITESYRQMLTQLQPTEGFTDQEIEEWLNIPNKTYGKVRLVVDIMNAIGACVVAGNIRRSAELAMARPEQSEFYKLKDYTHCPERRNINWMSNNTISLNDKEAFSKYIPNIANQLTNNQAGEPGIFNLVNAKRYGRVGAHYDPKTDKITREQEADIDAEGLNPCGETILASKELCCLAEGFMTRCFTDNIFNPELFRKALKCATFYALMVSILPTHSAITNTVISKNHRLGISISGIVKVLHLLKYSPTISILSQGYKTIRETAQKLANMCGVKEPLRVTVVKPSGTISLLVGSPPGAHYPVANRYVIRRKRVSDQSKIVPVLIDAGFKYEKDQFRDNTLVFDFPLDQGDCPSENDVNIYQQLEVAKLLQRWWADNSVSITIKYDKEEGQKLEQIIASNIPHIKALSFLPKSDTVYAQAPYEAISREKYEEMTSLIKKIDWKAYLANEVVEKNDGQMPKYCDGDKCEL